MNLPTKELPHDKFFMRWFYHTINLQPNEFTAVNLPHDEFIDNEFAHDEFTVQNLPLVESTDDEFAKWWI